MSIGYTFIMYKKQILQNKEELQLLCGLDSASCFLLDVYRFSSFYTEKEKVYFEF